MNFEKIRNLAFEEKDGVKHHLAFQDGKLYVDGCEVTSGEAWVKEVVFEPKKQVFPRVPENIKIMKDCDILGIKFGSEQVLCYDGGVWNVNSINGFWNVVICELVPCERSDLKAGDIGFKWNATDVNTADFTYLNNYRIVLDDEHCCGVAFNRDINNYNNNTGHWWRVRLIESDEE